ncbi:hypothetical protein QVD17_11972 [Tagetes erecta]|uniref:Uncharacterized protein n=1 Tax=Tagetes erecta TaxID=13708 RepID=A0AAD8P2I4_TARER|nr:hypothetical protein QVD17_11972 [Tagetes erecta]
MLTMTPGDELLSKSVERTCERLLSGAVDWLLMAVIRKLGQNGLYKCRWTVVASNAVDNNDDASVLNDKVEIQIVGCYWATTVCGFKRELSRPMTLYWGPIISAQGGPMTLLAMMMETSSYEPDCLGIYSGDNEYDLWLFEPQFNSSIHGATRVTNNPR